ncbi:hypothetical protein RYX36_023893 [Vicia faba]
MAVLFIKSVIQFSTPTATTGEDLSTAASGILSASIESRPTVTLKENTICSRLVPGCVSAEGPVTQAVISLNKHNSAKVDEFSKED